MGCGGGKLEPHPATAVRPLPYPDDGTGLREHIFVLGLYLREKIVERYWP